MLVFAWNMIQTVFSRPRFVSVWIELLLCINLWLHVCVKGLQVQSFAGRQWSITTLHDPSKVGLNTSWSQSKDFSRLLPPPPQPTSHPSPLSPYFLCSPPFPFYCATHLDTKAPLWQRSRLFLFVKHKNPVNCPCYQSESLVKTFSYKCKASQWLGASAKHPHTICLCHSAKEKYRKTSKHADIILESK